MLVQVGTDLEALLHQLDESFVLSPLVEMRRYGRGACRLKGRDFVCDQATVKKSAIDLHKLVNAHQDVILNQSAQVRANGLVHDGLAILCSRNCGDLT